MTFFKNFLFGLATFFLALSSLIAEIVDLPSFSALNPDLYSDALIILDLDDTLFTTEQILGESVWFRHHCQKTKEHLERSENGSDRGRLLKVALPFWDAIQYLTKVRVVEPCSVELIDRMQKESIPIMGLTTRSPTMAGRTGEHLASLHFDLSKTAPILEDWVCFNEGSWWLFQKGVLYTEGRDKGDTLLQFLDLLESPPRRVVFINDKASYLESVEKALNQRGIPFLGLRYGFSDARVANFRPEIADVQIRFSSFNQIMSDAKAEEVLKSLDGI